MFILLAWLCIANAVSSTLPPRLHSLYSKLESQITSSLTSSSSDSIRFTLDMEDEKIPIIVLRSGEITHIGLDLNMAQLCSSPALAKLVEQYLLAYLLNCDLKAYDFKVSFSQSKSALIKAGIRSLSSNLDMSLNKNADIMINLLLSNPQIKINFELPLNLYTIYGLDKKEMEDAIQHSINKKNEMPYPAASFPIISNLLPYKDELYVWEKTFLDTLLIGSLFLHTQKDSLKYVMEAKYPVESLINYLLLPTAFQCKIPTELEHLMYGKQKKVLQTDFCHLYSNLSTDMEVAVALYPENENRYSLLLIFFDRLTGIRHMLSGSYNPESLFKYEPEPMKLKLYTWISGSATEFHPLSEKQARWQLKIK